jgi:hypothetical protein
MGWPEAIPMFSATIGSALGLAGVFVVTLWSCARRFLNSASREVTNVEVFVMFVCLVALGISAWLSTSVSKMFGGLTTAMLATEATLLGLDRYEKPFAGLLAGLLVVVFGGLVIAAFYGTTNAMLRLVPFSGVKLTLLLPPLVILLYDLKRRIHPEPMLAVLNRPPLWGDLVLSGVLLLGAAILTIRSDNVSFVPGWEVRFRDLLERLLWVRPRTKEFLVGYPCLILYFAVKRRGWMVHYREAFRIGASLAYASAVNSFCHFHTLLPITIVRVVNGWWLGILVGFISLVVLVYIVQPLWSNFLRELFD